MRERAALECMQHIGMYMDIYIYVWACHADTSWSFHGEGVGWENSLPVSDACLCTSLRASARQTGYAVSGCTGPAQPACMGLVAAAPSGMCARAYARRGRAAHLPAVGDVDAPAGLAAARAADLHALHHRHALRHTPKHHCRHRERPGGGEEGHLAMPSRHITTHGRPLNGAQDPDPGLTLTLAWPGPRATQDTSQRRALT